MLRLRLYLGMLPVVGILTLICIYFVFNQNKQLRRLDELQNIHYSATTEMDRLLMAVSDLERTTSIREWGDPELLQWIYNSSKAKIEGWLHKTRQSKTTPAAYGESPMFPLLEEFVHKTDLLLAGELNEAPEPIRLLAEKIEEEALAISSLHYNEISHINQEFKDQAMSQYYVVVLGIILSVITMGIVAYLLSQRILAPVETLTQAAAHMTDEDWETDFQPSSKDEIASLEVAFVEMAERIREYKKYTNRRLVQIRRRMEACFDRLPHPVLFVDRNHRLIYKNPAGARLTRALGDVNAFPPRLKASISNTFSTGENILPTDFEETISIKVENEAEHYLPIVIRIDSENEEYVECALILQNVTSLRLSDELKSDLVATVGHEIKTPVTSANMALHLLLEKNLGDLNEDQEELLETAKSDLDRLRRILEHLLEIGRMEKTNSLSREPIEVEAIIKSVIDGHTLAAREKSMHLSAYIESDLPRIHADPKALEVVLSNFTSNALKYCPNESQIQIYAKRVGDKFRLGVLDDGLGIEPSEKEKVFDKFYRSLGRIQAGGVGLGLSIVKEIAFAHKGTVGCDPRKPKGCDFWFEIPIL